MIICLTLTFVKVIERRWKRLTDRAPTSTQRIPTTWPPRQRQRLRVFGSMPVLNTTEPPPPAGRRPGLARADRKLERLSKYQVLAHQPLDLAEGL